MHWLRLVLPHLVVYPAIFRLGTPRFMVRIMPGCAGLEGPGMIFGLTCLYLWVRRERLRFPAALLLLPLGVAVAWLANTVRLASLVLVGTHLSRGVASEASTPTPAGSRSRGWDWPC